MSNVTTEAADAFVAKQAALYMRDLVVQIKKKQPKKWRLRIERFGASVGAH